MRTEVDQPLWAITALLFCLVVTATLTRTVNELLPVITALGGALAMYVPRRNGGKNA